MLPMTPCSHRRPALYALVVLTVLALQGSFGCSTPAPPETEDEPLVAVCCGGACVDPTWSSSHETCVTAQSQAVALVPEAGFFELEGGPYGTVAGEAVGPRSRTFYAFRPADEAPADKPLVVFFNGGPGFTSMALLAMSTGPVTLDPTRTSGAPFADNPASWTRFANLLWIDEPGAGFSYHLPLADGTVVPIAFEPWRDAADFVRVLVHFLARHPQLEAGRVALAGESYGALRASFMLTLLRDYPVLAAPEAFYRDPALAAELAAHFARVRPDVVDRALTPDEVALQFRDLISIEGWLSSGIGEQQIVVPGCLPDGSADPYQCDEATGYTDGIFQQAFAALVAPDSLGQVLGVDVTQIEWFDAATRAGAYGRTGAAVDPAISLDESALVAAFGVLGPDDRYFLPWNRLQNGQSAGDIIRSKLADAVVLHALYRGRAFATAAGFDQVVPWQALAPALATNTTIVDAATMALVGGAPQELTLSYLATATDPAAVRAVRVGAYPTAGHMVSLRAPDELANDVAAFLAEP